ncbi:hypothetical protein CPARA_1gp128 (nucleomorph) [Cryptomonas paramecium]|uniref:Uncharacterized protein n=1 Tax=Cryptomonas paramaecium TaxID=2898 RepID=F2HHJ0_9CRYP|nr:hypothetical protein CPARA_1gp128 [Cryptomonas paramecium]AEA38786.1 hypothetical protein CPARA_1gp128 [Cryptomonas paramecium]
MISSPRCFFTGVKLWNESYMERKFPTLNISTYFFLFSMSIYTQFASFLFKKKNVMFICHVKN